MKNRLHLQINNQAYIAFSAKGVEALNTPFEFLIQTAAPSFEVAKSWMNGRAVFKIIANDFSHRVFSGCVTTVHPRAVHPDLGYYVEIVIRSAMWKQTLSGGVRFFLEKSAIDIVKQLLSEQPTLVGAAQFHLTNQYKIYPFVHQVFDETNLHFINRILAKEGIYWWTQSDENQDEILHFSDYMPAEAPVIIRENIIVVNRYSAEAYDPHFVGMHSLRLRHRWVPIYPIISAYDDNTPSHLSKTLKVTELFSAHYYGTGSITQNDVEKEAILRDRYVKSERKILETQGNVAEIIVGHQVKIEENFYFIKKIMHEIRPYNGNNYTEKECIYINDIIASPIELPYTPAIIDHRAITPPYMIAHVESNNAYATLNQEGYYKVRFNCDLSDRPKTEASPWIRCMQINGGPISQGAESVGFHFPLYDGAEVLIGFLQNDPNRPIIVGSLPNKINKSVVTNINAFENRWRTKADNELIMIDKPGDASISLRTYSGLNNLMLNAKENDNKIVLESKQGVLQVHAERAIEFKSEKDTYESIGQDKVEMVQLNHYMHVKGNVFYQAEKNIKIRADHSVYLYSLQSLHYQTGETWHITAGGGSIVSEEDDICIDVERGNILITADEIVIEGNGSGNIEFSVGEANTRAGFKIDKMGDITLFGDNILFKADTITLDGIVESSSTPTPKPPLGFVGMATPPKEPLTIQRQPTKREVTTHIIDEYELHFLKNHHILKTSTYELSGDKKQKLKQKEINQTLEGMDQLHSIILSEDNP